MSFTALIRAPTIGASGEVGGAAGHVGEPAGHKTTGEGLGYRQGLASFRQDPADLVLESHVHPWTGLDGCLKYLLNVADPGVRSTIADGDLPPFWVRHQDHEFEIAVEDDQLLYDEVVLIRGPVIEPKMLAYDVDVL